MGRRFGAARTLCGAAHSLPLLAASRPCVSCPHWGGRAPSVCLGSQPGAALLDRTQSVPYRAHAAGGFLPFHVLTPLRQRLHEHVW
jgi:hypothetical protein